MSFLITSLALGKNTPPLNTATGCIQSLLMLWKKRSCTAVFIDISQAFDKVWHPGLLYKLKKIFADNIWALLSSYLENRHFVIKVSNAVTKIFKINFGVPQASALGLSYIRYIHQIHQCVLTPIQQRMLTTQ